MTNNRTVNLTVGWAFILLGIAGIVLPILQGFLFIVVGLLFLSKEYVWAGKMLLWLKGWVGKHFPKTAKVFDNAEKFLEKEIYLVTNEKGYILKKLWIIIAIIVGLSVIGYLLALLFGWLWGLVFG